MLTMAGVVLLDVACSVLKLETSSTYRGPFAITRLADSSVCVISSTCMNMYTLMIFIRVVVFMVYIVCGIYSEC